MPSRTKKSPFAITRIILPVGQGAFYSETFSYKEDEKNQRELLSVVYDCGGQIGKIKAEIAKMKKPGLILKCPYIHIVTENSNSMFKQKFRI